MARAIHVAVRLGLPDLLANRPKDLSELALATASDGSTLHRLLRCLEELGIIRETAPRCYSSTPLSKQLQRDGSDSLYWLAMLYGEEWQLRAGERLEDSIRTGVSGMRQAFGTDPWTYLNQHPKAYNRALSGLGALNDQIASVYDFPEGAVVIDIGGGRGDFLARILARNPTVRGVLFDRKPVIDSAGIRDDPICHDRLSLIAGDFFESIPAGGDM